MSYMSELAIDKQNEERSVDCEKCGDEAGSKTVGDESVVYCKNCNWVTNN